MNILKIIFYGLLAFIERHPIFCTILVLLAIFAPFVFEIVGWIILGIITLLLIVFGILAWKVYKMKREMKKRFEQGGANFSGGSFGGQNFGGHFYAGGMTLEELVRQMQAQADAQQRAQQQRKSGGDNATTTSGSAQKRVSDQVGDYVDFEEVEE